MKKLVMFFFAVALVLPLSLTAVTNQDAQIAELMAQITALQERIEAMRAESSASPTALANQPLSGALEGLTRNLTRGSTDTSTNGEVTRLQRALSQIPEARFTATNVTGFYGPLTEASVRRVQESTGIVSSGTAQTTGYGAVGPRTRELINRTTPSIQYPRILPPTPTDPGSVTTPQSIPPSIQPIDLSSRRTIKVESPNGGETWTKGTTQTIKWYDLITTPSCLGCVAPAKFYDIKLAYVGCLNEPCPTLYYPPTFVAKNIIGNGSNSSFDWNVGKVLESSSLASDGYYKIQVCGAGTNTCDSSDSYFKIFSNTADNSAPQIVPSDIPTGATVGQEVSFSWTAKDADNDDLSWSVNWGDNTGVAGASPTSCTQSARNWSFTINHSWTQAGSYKVVATVSDCKGLSATNVQYITVGNTTNQSSITVTSPNGGETWTKGISQTVKWSKNIQDNKYWIAGFLKDGPTPGTLFGPFPLSDLGDSFTFKLQQSIFQGDVGSTLQPGSYKLELIVYDGQPCLGYCLQSPVPINVVARDTSDSYFKITDKGSITITYPNGGEILSSEGIYRIKWVTSGIPADATGFVRWVKSGAETGFLTRNFPLIGTIIKDGNFFTWNTWNVPTPLSPGQYVIQIGCDLSTLCDVDSSDTSFTITAPGTVLGAQTVDLYAIQAMLNGISATIQLLK